MYFPVQLSARILAETSYPEIAVPTDTGTLLWALESQFSQRHSLRRNAYVVSIVD